MRKEIDPKTAEKLYQIRDAVADVPNIVPGDIRTTFNFKGRKSVGVAEKIIETVADQDTVLYEPFMGSGTFVIAASGKVREIYATELDNYTFSAVAALLQKVDRDKLEQAFGRTEDMAKAPIMRLYETACCGRKNHISKLLFDPEAGEEGLFNPLRNREIIDGNNIKLSAVCPVCGRKAKKFDRFDLDRLREISRMDTARFPDVKYIENSRINITASKGADRYGRIFTKRNKAALLLLQDAVTALESGPERDLLEQVLTASLSLARIAMYGSSTDILYHVVGRGAQEMNVWELFAEKYRHFVRFKEKYPAAQTGGSTTKIHLFRNDYAAFIDSHPEIKADIIYTDFPYTDQVPYLERNQLYRIWLETFYDRDQYRLTQEMLDQEIVQTNAPARENKKSLAAYYRDIDNMFLHFNKILKEKGLVFFTIKLGKAKYIKTYTEIINLARKNGFEYAYQCELEKKDPTLRKQSAFANTFMNEIVAVFYKLPAENRYWYMGGSNFEFIAVKKVYSYLLHAEGAVTVSAAVRLVCDELQENYALLPGETEMERIRSLLGRYFVTDSGFLTIDSNRLYLDIEDTTDLYTKLYDLIPIFIRKLLDGRGRFVLEDIYFELIHALCDGNPGTIIQILEEENHQADIEQLLLNYCALEGPYYVERGDIVKPNEHAVDISTLGGTEFEILVQRLLKEQGYENVVKMGGAGDLGVDIIAVKRDRSGSRRCIIQCKRWASKVGSAPIQRLYAERMRRNFDEAVCVTTSGYTRDGKKVAKDLAVATIDGTGLMKQLNRYFPGEYYNGILRQ